MILPCGIANYYRYLAQWLNSDTTLVCVITVTVTVGIQTHPYRYVVFHIALVGVY